MPQIATNAHKVNSVADFMDEIHWGVSPERLEAARTYDTEMSNLIVLQGDDGNGSYANMWAIFDVSATTLIRYIAVYWEKSHPNEQYRNRGALVVFDRLDDLLSLQNKGAKYRNSNQRKKKMTQPNS